MIQMDQSAGKKRKALGDENIIRIMIAGKSAAAAEDLPRAVEVSGETSFTCVCCNETLYQQEMFDPLNPVPGFCKRCHHKPEATFAVW